MPKDITRKAEKKNHRQVKEMKSNLFTAVLALTVLASVEAQVSIGDIQKFVQERSECACVTEVELDKMIDDNIEKAGGTNRPGAGAGCSDGYSSCQQIREAMPNSPSGYYDLVVSGKDVKVYCSMETLCGNEGGWTRMAFLNMSDSSENCPTNFKLYDVNGVRACGRSSHGTHGCHSAMFPSKGISYTQVCGRLIGYQKGSPDALIGNRQNIDHAYVDGVSITRGTEPRTHIWTLAAGLQETYPTPNAHMCPCTSDVPFYPRSFMGNDFYCESGQPATWDTITLLTDDPLWDGEKCRGTVEEKCCEASGLPWFHKIIQQPTNDDIELRVCADEVPANEDVPVSLYEIYVQ